MYLWGTPPSWMRRSTSCGWMATQVSTQSMMHSTHTMSNYCSCCCYTTDLIRYSGPSTVNDAVKVRMGSEGMEECEASADVLMSDTMDQYRTFQMCERLLHNPTKLANQLLFQIPPHRQAMLIERCDLVLHRPVLWPYQWVDILT